MEPILHTTRHVTEQYMARSPFFIIFGTIHHRNVSVCVCVLYACAQRTVMLMGEGYLGMKLSEPCVQNNHPHHQHPQFLTVHYTVAQREPYGRFDVSPPSTVPDTSKWIPNIYTCVHQKTSQVRVRLELFCKHRFTKTLNNDARSTGVNIIPLQVVLFVGIHNNNIYIGTMYYVISILFCAIIIVYGFVIND